MTPVIVSQIPTATCTESDSTNRHVLSLDLIRRWRVRKYVNCQLSLGDTRPGVRLKISGTMGPGPHEILLRLGVTHQLDWQPSGPPLPPFRVNLNSRGLQSAPFVNNSRGGEV